ncbi:MAG: hypothetical protein K6D97_01135 [Clostridia bacterium]|nr:hypothetical protein [Clostridia bacterium]
MTVKDNKTILMLGILATLFIIAIALIISGNRKEEVNYSELSEEELDAVINEEIEDMEVKELANMEERERMEWYVSKFVKRIENGEYADAYDVLNEEFKTRYFKTLDDFEEYSKKNFPKMMSLEHTNIERIGNQYVLWVNLSNSLRGKASATEMKFVIREHELNKYELSFSVQE